MVTWLMNDLLSWLAEKLIELLGGLLAFLASSIFVSPNVTVLPQVQSIADKCAVVVSACFVLAIIAVGVTVMVGDSVQMRYGVKELIPRLVVGLVLSSFALPLTAVVIDVANTLTVSMVGDSAPTAEAVTFVRARLVSAMTAESGALLLVVVGLLIVVLMFILVGSWLARIGVLVVLAGIAPLALACYCTPWTQDAAQLWWRTLLGCLATPTLQAVAFSAGINLLTDPEANLPILLGLPGSETVNLLLVIVVLWVTVKIPGFIRRQISHTGSPNIGGVLLRAMLIQSVTRHLPLGRLGRPAMRGGR